MSLFRAALIVIAMLLIILAASIAATLLWWAPWPPSGPASERGPWLLAFASLAVGVAVAYWQPGWATEKPARVWRPCFPSDEQRRLSRPTKGDRGCIALSISLRRERIRRHGGSTP